MKNDKAQVLAAYISLVGEVNRTLQSRVWWATDFSSKNRFNNRLPELIDEFIKTAQVPASLQSFAQRKGIVIEFVKRLTGGCYHFFRLTARYLYARFLLSTKLQKVFLNQQPSYVIKTFVYDHSFLNDGTYSDVFFGQLPKFLEERGERVIFFANILGDFRSCLKKIAECPNAVIIPIDFCGSLVSILKSAFVSCFYWPQVKGPINFGDDEVSDIINAELSSGSSRIQSYQYLHYHQTKVLSQRIPIKTFLMTYENNPWEKMCVSALRATSPKTGILGYQHTVTPQASVNMFISVVEESVIPKPDRVLTVGAVTKEIIERYTQISSLPIIASCALRYENLLKLGPLPRTKSFKILVALEGVGDVYKMVNYLIEQLNGQSKYQIIIRTHPVLPVSRFSDKLVKKLTDLPFVEISQDHSIIQDIERTDLTIYWGSTVSLESLWLGKPVIHFDMDSFLSYDPLFDCPYLKWTVTETRKLTEVLDEIYSLSDEKFFSARQKAHDYLSRYFYPVNSSNLAHFLS